MTCLLIASILTGCSPGHSGTDRRSGVGSTSADASIYEQAVAHPGRSAADRARDASRHPAAVLEFFGIRPGMAVLDMYSGGGYYTELLSYIVGPEGRVIAHTNEAYARFVGEEATQRYANDRLPNVDVLIAENNELELPPGQFDAVMLILAYHDIYYVAPDSGWPRIDGPAFIAELREALKPGGLLSVVDHYAAAGAPAETGNTLHRIDPAIVIAELEAAGFRLEAQSDILRNTDDDHSLYMADPSVSGKTDRFVMRFRKAD
jgi:predicted methyltransferase